MPLCAPSPPSVLPPGGSPGGGVVHVQQRLVEVGQVQVVLGLVVLGERLVLGRRELAEGRQVRVHVRHVEAVRLVEVTVAGGRREGVSAFERGYQGPL